ncbi:MAG: DUF5696 domain-containing protein [Victivallales bacterium]
MGSVKALIEARSADMKLTASAPGWRGGISSETVARCQLYNTMEARVEWQPVIVEWAALSSSADGWRLPCHVDIPFYGTVINFEIVGHPKAELGAYELSIPLKTLVEKDTSFARLMRIDLLPDFSTAANGEEGYILLPCLAGAIHRFTHQVSREERITVYASQEQWAMRSNFNCFGMHRPTASWCAIVTEGEFDAEAVIRSHYEEKAVDSIHAGLVYRWEPNDPMLNGDRTVRYYLRDPQAGGWAEFARCYRRFLREERGVRTWAQKSADNPSVLKFARGFVMKIMQGYKQITLDGRGQYCSCTSFDEARQILEQMQADGISHITAQMVGWNHEGHDGRYPSRFPVNPVEGGEKGFRELIEWGRSHGHIISVHDNIYDSRELGEDFRRDELIVLRDGAEWRNIPWAGGLTYKLCPVCAPRIVERDFPKMKALGIHGNYYLDAVAAFFPCHSPVHPASRAEFIAAMRKLFTYTRNLFGTLSLEVPYGAYFDLMDGVYSDDSMMWLDNFTDFRRNFIDDVVPFLPVALHNSVRYNRSGRGRADALRALAWGAMPFVELAARPAAGAHSMPTYADIRVFAMEGYKLCCEEHVDLLMEDLENVDCISPDLFSTQYANGVRLLINAGKTPAAIEGKTIPAESVLRI